MIDRHGRWPALLMDALAGAGVRDVVLSPGSRSTPFVLAATVQPGLRCHDIIDERSAAFFALGMARATGRPALLLCTSGTAPAHYYPAIIEAAVARLPLLVLSADRPFELTDCGAPQTIDQIKLFGGFVRRYVELGLADDHPDAERGLRRAAAHAVAACTDPEPGPVHLNARARKPLEPERLEPWQGDSTVTQIHAPLRLPSPAAIAAVAELCCHSRRGLIVAGPTASANGADELRQAIARLRTATGFPLLAEAASQLRFTGAAAPPEPSLLGALAADPANAPDLFLQFGAVPTASAWEAVIDSQPRAIFTAHGRPDPRGTALHIVVGDLAASATALADAITTRPAETGPAWPEQVAAQSARWQRAVRSELAFGELTEGHIAHAVVATLPPGAQLAIGNSLPIRAIDAFAPDVPPDCAVLVQRGANGIDGLVSGAAGAACATGRPTTLLIGDVSLLHDLNGLHALRHVRAPLTIVVINNDGGRIFEQLPVRGVAPAHLGHFTTPHGLGFAAAAALFGIHYDRVETIGALTRALTRAEGTTLIEARVPPSGATEQAYRLAARMKENP